MYLLQTEYDFKPSTSKYALGSGKSKVPTWFGTMMFCEARRARAFFQGKEDIKMADSAIIKEEHKRLFDSWLETVKGNAVFFSRSDLENVQTYLISLKNGVSSDIALNLKRRIKKNKFILSTFPSADDCVCVLEASTSYR